MSQPLIFAHRGANQIAPENTLPAFEAASRLAADGIELDVQYSADGQLVVIHDLTLEKTTNGAGRVTAHTAAELRALDAGAWFGPAFVGTRIPLLDEALDLCRTRHLLLNIELKVVTGLHSTIGRDVVAAVRRHEMAAQVIISSFNPFALRGAKQAGPEIECALLLAPDLPGWMRWGITRGYSLADGLHPQGDMIDAGYMARAGDRPVRAWTVNEPTEMKRLAGLGVAALITDAPDLARTQLT